MASPKHHATGRAQDAADPPAPFPRDYVLEDQVGFVLRQASQRHAAIFATRMGTAAVEGLTPTQWAALAKLAAAGPLTQTLLGRLTAMDAATIKGVVDRLTRRGLTATGPDPEDGRRLVVAVTDEGRRAVDAAPPAAAAITAETLDRLTGAEAATLMRLLRRLG